jgi:hypothetical protein
MKLPKVVLIYIASFLDGRDLCNVRCVNKRLNRALYDKWNKTTWKNTFRKFEDIDEDTLNNYEMIHIIANHQAKIGNIELVCCLWRNNYIISSHYVEIAICARDLVSMANFITIPSTIGLMGSLNIFKATYYNYTQTNIKSIISNAIETERRDFLEWCWDNDLIVDKYYKIPKSEKLINWLDQKNIIDWKQFMLCYVPNDKIPNCVITKCLQGNYNIIIPEKIINKLVETDNISYLIALVDVYFSAMTLFRSACLNQNVEIILFMIDEYMDVIEHTQLALIVCSGLPYLFDYFQQPIRMICPPEDILSLCTSKEMLMKVLTIIDITKINPQKLSSATYNICQQLIDKRGLSYSEAQYLLYFAESPKTAKLLVKQGAKLQEASIPINTEEMLRYLVTTPYTQKKDNLSIIIFCAVQWDLEDILLTLIDNQDVNDDFINILENTETMSPNMRRILTKYSNYNSTNFDKTIINTRSWNTFKTIWDLGYRPTPTIIDKIKKLQSTNRYTLRQFSKIIDYIIQHN